MVLHESHIELTSMLDSLGSTLSTETIDSFFPRWGKNPRTDELMFPETIWCLETEICRHNSKKHINPFENEGRDHEPGNGTGSSSHTPNLHMPGLHTLPLRLNSLSFSGPLLHISDASLSSYRHPGPQAAYQTEPPQTQVADQLQGGINASRQHPPAVCQTSMSSSAVSDVENTSGASLSGNGSGSSSDEAFKRMINIKNCLLCHRPRPNSKAEQDIVTHLAVCASQDWARINRVMVSNFVTAIQAQRKWYTNVLSKVSAGNYKIGAVEWPISFSLSYGLSCSFSAQNVEFCEYYRTE
jgi:phosphatidylserine decarboxylase